MQVEWVEKIREDCQLTSIKRHIDVFLENVLPAKIWVMIFSYLSLIDLFNVSTCSKLFYLLAHKNDSLKLKLKDPHSLMKCSHNDLFDRCYGHALIFCYNISEIFQNKIDEDVFLLLKKGLWVKFCLICWPLEFFITCSTVTEVFMFATNLCTVPGFKLETSTYLII